MNKEILDLLPKKKECSRHYNTSPNICDCGAKGFNQAIDDVIAALDKADLCVVPSEDRIYTILADNPVTSFSPDRMTKRHKEQARKIRSLMLGKD